MLPSSFTRVVRSTPYTVWGERGGQEEVGGCGESEEGKGGEEENEEEEAEEGRRRGGEEEERGGGGEEEWREGKNEKKGRGIHVGTGSNPLDYNMHQQEPIMSVIQPSPKATHTPECLTHIAN